MTLLLPHRWEHALVAATVKAANEHHPNCTLGRTALQKLLYFMKVLGVPMEYDFDIHHFGPFCSDVGSDVEWLLADDVILDKSDKESSSCYKPGENLDELRQQFSERLGKHSSTIQTICKALGEMSPRSLELISTIDFSYRWVKARGGNGPWKPSVIAKFKEIKKEKFTDEDIEKWYKILVETTLIEA